MAYGGREGRQLGYTSGQVALVAQVSGTIEEHKWYKAVLVDDKRTAMTLLLASIKRADNIKQFNVKKEYELGIRESNSYGVSAWQ